MAQEVKTLGTPHLEDTILNENSPAPFKGVLVPPSTYRNLKTAWENNQLLMANNKSLVDQCLASEEQNHDILFFVLAFIGGGVLGYALSR